MEGGLGQEATDKELSGGVCVMDLDLRTACFGVLQNTSFSMNVVLCCHDKGVVNRFASTGLHVPDSLDSVEACGAYFYHAAVSTQWCRSYDVFFDCIQWNPTDHEESDQIRVISPLSL